MSDVSKMGRKLNVKRAALWGSSALWIAMTLPAQADDAISDQNEPILLGEIVISARRVEENLNEAPVPVSVTSTEEIGTGKRDALEDIAKTAPNVVGFNANGTSFVIRGVGSQTIQGIGSEVGVGLFLDEVYLGNPDAAPLFLDDLERAEIVRGSQATLYGRNTIGGAINLVPREPGDVVGGEAEVSYANDGYYRFRGAFDAPLADGRWRSRTFLSITDRPDGIDNISTGEDDLGLRAYSARFTLVGDLNDRTQLKFSLDAEKVDDDSKGGWAPVALAFDNKSSLDYPANREDRRGGASLRIDHDFDGFKFSSITSYRGFDQEMELDGDFTSGPYDPSLWAFELQQGRVQDQRQFTQEFRFGSHNSTEFAGDLSWNAGLFFMDESLEGYEFYEMVGIPADQTSRNVLNRDGKTYAVFGNLSYQATDDLTFTIGARYTREKKEGDVAIESASGTFFYGAPQSGSTRADFDNFSPEASVDYRLANGGLLYGRIATGFKSGGIAQFFNADGSVNVFDPETSTTYEIGLKTPVFNQSGWLEINLFNTKWSDQQSNVFISDIQRVTANASSATTRGLEVAFQMPVTEELDLSASYGYLDAEYDDFVYSYFSSGLGATQTVDYSGNPIPLSPKHSASLSLDWQRDLGNGMTLLANGTYSYRSSYTFDSVGAFEQPETHLLDASIGLRADQWEAHLWATNLLDEDYLSGYFLFGSTDYGVGAPGRRVGITLRRVW